MKPFFLFGILLALSTALRAQNTPIFMFDQFIDAKVYFKNHSTTTVPMNYNATNNLMYFKQGNEVMELINIATIDSIVWTGKHKFVVRDAKFLEEVRMENGCVYILWRIKNVNVGSKGAMGMTTQAKVETVSLESLGIYSSDQKSKSADLYRQKNDNDYFIYRNGKMEKVKTLKHLERLYPTRKEDIAAYAKEKRTNMKDAQDALTLLNYCLQFDANNK